MKELTILQKAILTAIKSHNAGERKDDLEQYNNKIQFLEMEPHRKSGSVVGETKHYEYPNADKNDWTESIEIQDVYMRLRVKCKFKPQEKYMNNIVYYEVLLISSGKIVIYFDGTEYEAA